MFTAAAGLAAVAPAHAQVLITIHDSRVSLVAKDATLGQILAEWAKVGETMFVNSERIPGGPLTLQLTDVPEAEALDILLRVVSGTSPFRGPAGRGLVALRSRHRDADRRRARPGRREHCNSAGG